MRGWAPGLCALAWLLLWPAAGRTQAVEAAAGPHVDVQPLGSVPPALLEAIAVALRAEYGATVVVLPPVAPPADAWQARRKRYQAGALLRFLGPRARPDAPGGRVLGVTARDIGTPKNGVPDWGVFGLGETPGQAAVISTHRLGRRARDEAHVQSRVVSTAVHEVGHTLGLPHCTEVGCVMQDAEGSIRNTDEGTGHLGPGCRAKLRGE